MKQALVAQKMGMTRIFQDDGSCVPVTVLKVLECTVLGKKNQESDGYDALKCGYNLLKPKKISKPEKGYFSKLGVEEKSKLIEFRVDNLAEFEVGSPMDAHLFTIGQLVDVTGKSIGKGFAGAMKRHNFGGLRASHGVSVSHRSHGSTGNRQDPGKTFKNKKMAGHMGDVKVTKLNIKIQSIDTDLGILYLKGAVPGPKGGVLQIRNAIKSIAKK